MELKFLGRDSGFGEKNNSAYYIVKNKLVIIDCGFTVFNIVKNMFDFNEFEEVEIVITHLHNDHAGSLSQLILYLWFVYHKKASVISKCSRIREYLDITGTLEEIYELKDSTLEIEFIKTQHVPSIEAYGFIACVNNKKFLYTGDTSTLEPFKMYYAEIDELYIDICVGGEGHLKINDVLDDLKLLKQQNKEIHLMHLDNKEKIKNIVKNEFYFE